MSMAAVAAKAPGLLTIFSGLEAAVATMLNEPASKGRSPIVMRIAPMFCKNSPPSAAETKNGGMVTKRNNIFTFCIDSDQTGFPAVNGITW